MTKSLSTIQRPVSRSHISPDQSKANVKVTWSLSTNQKPELLSLLTQPLASPPAPETICTNHSTMHLSEIFRKHSAPPSHESERAMRWEEVQTEFSKGDSQHTSQSRFRNIIDVVKIQGSFFTFFKFWNKLEKHFSLLVWDKGVIVLMAADSAVSVMLLYTHNYTKYLNNSMTFLFHVSRHVSNKLVKLQYFCR